MIDNIERSEGEEMQENREINRKKNQMSDATVALRNKAADLGDNVREIASLAKDAGRESFNKLRDTAIEDYQVAKERVADWEDALEGYVRERPLKSLLLAALAGMVFAKVWRK